MFCKRCINKWKKFNKICPLCRAPFNKIQHYINYPTKPLQTNDKLRYKKEICTESTKIKSHKLSEIVFCDICKKYGSTASVFTCQICRKYKAHIWCEEATNFQLGIYMSCM